MTVRRLIAPSWCEIENSGITASNGRIVQDMAVPVDELNTPFVSIDPARRAGEAADFDSSRWLVQTELGHTLFRYDDVVAVLRDRRWHSEPLALAPEREPEFEEWARERQKNLLGLNGEDHQRLRRVVSPWLTPQRISGFRPRMREEIDELLAGAAAKESCEFISEVAEPYATHVIFDLVGTSPEWRERFRALTSERMINMGSPSHEIIEVTTAFDELVDELLDEWQSPRPESLLAIVRQAESQNAVSRQEAIMLVRNVIGGATDSTLAQLGSAVVLFGRFDDEYQRLRDQPDLAAWAIEEVMRLRGAARGTTRKASEDIEYRDVLFPRGTRLTLSFVSANKDVDAYENPGRFDISRDEASHTSFGHGAHFCIGAALARAELSEALAALARHVSRIEITGEIQWRPPTIDFWGPAKLPVRLVE